MAAEHVLGAAGAGVFTPAGFAEALARGGQAIAPAVVRALKRVGKVPRAIAIAKFRSRGVGRGIFGKKPKGAFGLVKVGSVFGGGKLGGKFILSLELRGFAALQEKGGRTKPHDIEPLNKKALRLNIHGPGDVVRNKVRHPGSTIPRHPFAADALRTAAPRIQQEIDREIVSVLAKLRVA